MVFTIYKEYMFVHTMETHNKYSNVIIIYYLFYCLCKRHTVRILCSCSILMYGQMCNQQNNVCICKCAFHYFDKHDSPQIGGHACPTFKPSIMNVHGRSCKRMP